MRIVIGESAPGGVEDLPLGEDATLVVDGTEYAAIVSSRYFDDSGHVVAVSFSLAPQGREFVQPSLYTVELKRCQGDES